MDFGVHLPVLRLRSDLFAAPQLAKYGALAEDLGFTTVCANDHLLALCPWLDGLAVLAAVAGATQRATLMTTVALPVLRGPAQLAKFLATLDVLSGGRVVAGVGSGNSPRDFALAGVPFEQRRQRFEEAVCLLRSLLREDAEEPECHFYRLDGAKLEPPPIQKPGIPVWVSSWGSEEGLRQVVLGDGWITSHVTPEMFQEFQTRLAVHLKAAGKNPDDFPNAVGTMFFYLTESRGVADALLNQVLSPTLNRPAKQLRDRSLVGPADECIEKLVKLQEVGVERVLVWPVADEFRQLTAFCDQVVARLPSSALAPPARA